MSERDTYYHQALLAHRQNQAEEAITLLRQTLALDPRFEDAHEALAVVLHNAKRYDESIAALKAWIQVNPGAVLAHTNLSRCYMAKGMILEAEREQTEARRLTWKAELTSKKSALPKADVDDQIRRYKKVIEFDPADVLGYYSLGSTYLNAGMFRDAADAFEKGLEVNPDHSSSYLGLGQALIALGDKQKARTVFQKGIPVADRLGDMIPQKKMEGLLHELPQ